MGYITPVDKSEANLRSAAYDISDLLEEIERTYTLYAGPIAKHVIPEAYEYWSSSYEPRLATVIKYVNRLAATLPDKVDSERFAIDAASNILTRHPQRDN